MHCEQLSTKSQGHAIYIFVMLSLCFTMFLRFTEVQITAIKEYGQVSSAQCPIKQNIEISITMAMFWSESFETCCFILLVFLFSFVFYFSIELNQIEFRLIDETWIKSFDWLSVWRKQMEIGYRCRTKKRVWWNEIRNGRKKHFEGVFGSHPSSPLVDSMTLIHIERQFALTRKVRVQIACYRHLHIRTITWENGLRYLIKWRGLALQTN